MKPTANDRTAATCLHAKMAQTTMTPHPSNDHARSNMTTNQTEQQSPTPEEQAAYEAWHAADLEKRQIEAYAPYIPYLKHGEGNHRICINCGVWLKREPYEASEEAKHWFTDPVTPDDEVQCPFCRDAARRSRDLQEIVRKATKEPSTEEGEGMTVYENLMASAKAAHALQSAIFADKSISHEIYMAARHAANLAATAVEDYEDLHTNSGPEAFYGKPQRAGMTTKKHLMNPHTGSVDTEENWRSDARTDGWDFDKAELVEVEKDENGDWKEV